MKKILAFAFMLATFSLKAQKNVFLEQSFWKENPDVAAVKSAIEKGNDPLAFNPASFDAATFAINNGAPNETVKYLVELPGAGVSRLTHDSRIYLHWAAYKGNVALVEYLLAKGSDVNREDSHGYVPVAFAANAGQTDPTLYEAFFKAGVDPKKKYKDGVNLLLMGIANDKNLKLTEYFISKGLSLKDVDDNGSTAFDYAARSGNIELMKTLLQKGVKPTNNALLMAAQGTRSGANGIALYKYLVEEVKLKPTAVNTNGQTVLHALVRRPNQAEIIQYFLGKAVDVNKADNDGNTAFMNAVSGRDAALIELLLSKVKNINAVNTKGESALTAAVKSSSAETVTLLLDKGADINVKDKDGNNLAYYLVQSYRPQAGGRGPGGEGSAPGGGQRPGGEGAPGGENRQADGARPGDEQKDDFTEKLKIFQTKGLNLSAPQQDGNTLYHLAVAKGDMGLLKKIAELKADINAKNKEGVTALHKAAMISKNDAILKYLLSLGAKKDITTEFEETAYDLAKENDYLTKNNVSVDFLK
ncbi:hypothetical protein DC498_25675 [Terrimonas sp.]|uniref:ankyrin repeat domain-containing protein n=1 Tax=Terrimonas sp. TaxID=1914338 RepID=UPI000D51FC2C|nr:ankyrin repeat domain-containing protein [Terrimonas sp.]PVD49314.1 hypothetical protein DC498_25675 [Terrimonas sp.]